MMVCINKLSYSQFQGSRFEGILVQPKIVVCDSPNSARVFVDVDRHVKLIATKNQVNPMSGVCPFYRKTPSVPMTNDETKARLYVWLKEILASGK